MKKVLFILNPAAGIRKVRDLEALIKDNLDLNRFEYEIKVTSRQGDAYEMTMNSVREGCCIVAAVGGDGTINEIAKGIEGTQTQLAIIPNGSGNGLARHLGLPLEVAEAIRIINRHTVKTIDTGSVNGHTFVSLAGVGFDARVANRYRKVRRRGFYGYFRIVVLEYFGYKERSYLLEVDGRPLQRKALFITAANSNQFGYGTIIAPSARLDDGLLNVVIVRKFPVTELPHILQLLFSQRIDKSSYMETITCKEVTISRNKGRWVNVDGEAIKTDTKVQIRVKPGSLNIIVPDRG